MTAVNMLQPKNHLPYLVESLEQGIEKEIIISCKGRPVARLMPLVTQTKIKRIGTAKGKFEVTDDIDQSNAEVVTLFNSTSVG